MEGLGSGTVGHLEMEGHSCGSDCTQEKEQTRQQSMMMMMIHGDRHQVRGEVCPTNEFFSRDVLLLSLAVPSREV